MSEKIVKIEELLSTEDSEQIGFQVTTDRREFFILLEDGAQCCERWGTIISEDDPQQFVGADLQEAYLTNSQLKDGMIQPFIYYQDDDRYGRNLNLLFVNFVTSKGTLQFVLYNAHNGYYGHLAQVYYIENTQRQRIYEGKL